MELVSHYKHIHDFIEDLSTVKGAQIGYSGGTDMKHQNFTGSKSYEEAVLFASDGYEMNLFKEAKSEVSKLSRTAREVSEYYDVQGSYVDVGLYLEGEPECMVDFQQVEKRKSLDIFIQMGEQSSSSAASMKNKGVIISCLVDDLESLGIRCRIHSCSYSDYPLSRRRNILLAVLIKDYEQPLDISKVSGAVHPAFNRRLKFRWIEKYFSSDSNGGGNKGYYGGAKNEMDQEKLKEIFGSENVLSIPNVAGFKLKFNEDLSTLASVVRAYQKLLKEVADQLDINIELQD